MRTWTRVLAVVAVTTLVAAACGTRADDDSVAAEDTEEVVVPAADDDSPCGEGDASGATDVGVTDDTITIGTIQDVGGELRPDLMIGPLEAIQAFVEYCNTLGGINGRELVLQEYDSELLEHARAAEEACEGDNFAMVGSASAQDNQGSQILVDCGLPNVPTFTATTPASDADLMFQPVPNPAYEYSAGPCSYIAEQYPDAVAAAATTYTDYPVTDLQKNRQIEACEPFGFDFVSEQSTNPLGEDNWPPKLVNMRNAEVGYYTHWGEKEDIAQAVINAEQQGIEFEVVDAGPQMYDPALPLLAEGAAEGMLIWITVNPLEEVDEYPEMQKYFEWLERIGGDDPTALGIQTWSAGLLFATAVEALGSDVTREGLLAELEGITEWTGNGLHHPTNPGENRAAHCFMFVEVVGDGFERHYPDEGFDCDEDHRVTLTGDYGEGASVSD